MGTSVFTRWFATVSGTLVQQELPCTLTVWSLKKGAGCTMSWGRKVLGADIRPYPTSRGKLQAYCSLKWLLLPSKFLDLPVRFVCTPVLNSWTPSLYLADRASFSNSFYFFTNLIHLVCFTILAYLSLHVSDQSVHHQEDQMLKYTSSFWRRSLGRWSVVCGRWC